MNRTQIAVLGVGTLLVSLILWTCFFTTNPQVQDREEIAAVPGAVVSREVTTTVPELYQEAKALLEKGEIAQAERVYRRIIAAEPKNAGGYVGLGTCLITQWDRLCLKVSEQNSVRVVDSSVGSRRRPKGSRVKNLRQRRPLDTEP